MVILYILSSEEQILRWRSVRHHGTAVERLLREITSVQLCAWFENCNDAAAVEVLGTCTSRIGV